MSKKTRKIKYSIGIDEVGRGPLAGPVTVCVFAMLEKKLKYLNEIEAKDSKVLSEKKRNIVAAQLKSLSEQGLCVYEIVSIDSKIIDKKGITKAIQMAINSALKKLNILPEYADIYLDGGLKAPKGFIEQQTIIKGDRKIPVISCASILAKVHRDHYMVRISELFPQYGFERHKGYGTRLHYEAIKKYGLTALHRKTFLKSFDKQ